MILNMILVVLLESDPEVGVELESNLESNLSCPWLRFGGQIFQHQSAFPKFGFQTWIAGRPHRGSYTRTAMKLLTHNMLMSPGTKNGYPLAIEVEKMETVETEFNGEFTARMVEKLDYAALLSTLRSVSDAGPPRARTWLVLRFALASDLTARISPLQLSVETGLPAAVPAEYAGDEEFLKALHHALMEIEILEGYLVCPETQKKFPIREGIPSML